MLQKSATEGRGYSKKIAIIVDLNYSIKIIKVINQNK